MKEITKKTNTPEIRPLGEIITERLEAKDMKQSELCDLTGIAKPLLNDVVKGRRNLTAEMAVLIESAIGLSADAMLSVQMACELEKAYNDANIISRIQAMSDWDEIKEKVSVPVLKKLGFGKSNVTDKVATIMRLFHVSGIDEFKKIASEEQKMTYFKKSEKLNVDRVALFTWKYYCMDVASETPMRTSFKKESINKLAQEVKSVITENNNTYERVKEVFMESGIRLLYIDKIGQVPVDGMSFWLDANPTIIITRRLQNIDNFAFSVMHELGHVKMHLKENSSALVNIDGVELDKMEAEANKYARDIFVPQNVWDSFMEDIADCNPYAVHVPISKLATRLKVNPQILYGRYMHDTGLYRLRRVFPTVIK